jgi:hypothetical protein
MTARGLAIQGFPIRSEPSLGSLAPWLRLTPSLSALWIVTGTALASPALLLAFAAVSAFGASQRKHPFDLLYNRGLRPLVGSAPLPDNPPPRRFAMGLAAAWAAASAALFASGHRRAGYVAGSLLGVAGTTVATTHFCLGSWIYRQLGRIISGAADPTSRSCSSD